GAARLREEDGRRPGPPGAIARSHPGLLRILPGVLRPRAGGPHDRRAARGDGGGHTLATADADRGPPRGAGPAQAGPRYPVLRGAGRSAPLQFGGLAHAVAASPGTEACPEPRESRFLTAVAPGPGE